jgi:hypothetical protein
LLTVGARLTLGSIREFSRSLPNAAFLECVTSFGLSPFFFVLGFQPLFGKLLYGLSKVGSAVPANEVSDVHGNLVPPAGDLLGAGLNGDRTHRILPSCYGPNRAGGAKGR